MPRSITEIANKVVYRCWWEKVTSSAFGAPDSLTDYDPLIKVGIAIADQIGEEKLSQPKYKRLWKAAMKLAQSEEILEHNSFIPCRYCATAFEPVINDVFVEMFFDFYDSFKHNGIDTEMVCAIHRCPDCGGALEAGRQQQYKGDMHTPEPNDDLDDESWVHSLLHCGG